MKKHLIFLMIFFALFAVVLSACTIDEMMSAENQTWQDSYAKLLRKSSGKEFFLFDIDDDGIPELLVGGPPIEMDKYAEYDVYTYKENNNVHIGDVSTLHSSSLWIDNNNGLLGYAYGAGAGATHRYFIDNGILCYDDEIYGYFYDNNGNYTEWFRDLDGSKIIVTEEIEDEYQRIWNGKVELERYDVTENNIKKVIHGGI